MLIASISEHNLDKPLEGPATGLMVIHQKGDHFAKTHVVWAITFPFTIRYLIFLPVQNKGLTKII